MDVDTCILCGEPIPEGIQVCPLCESRVKKDKPDDEQNYQPQIFKGDIYYADLNPVVGSEVGGIRPVLVIQNDVGNRFSPTIVTAITSRMKKKHYPMHVPIDASVGGLPADSTIMLEQIRTIDKRRIKGYIGHLDVETMQLVDAAAKIALGISEQDIQKGKNI